MSVRADFHFSNDLFGSCSFAFLSVAHLGKAAGA